MKKVALMLGMMMAALTMAGCASHAASSDNGTVVHHDYKSERS